MEGRRWIRGRAGRSGRGIQSRQLIVDVFAARHDTGNHYANGGGRATQEENIREGFPRFAHECACVVAVFSSF
jgi:hypothetical protein